MTNTKKSKAAKKTTSKKEPVKDAVKVDVTEEDAVEDETAEDEVSQEVEPNEEELQGDTDEPVEVKVTTLLNVRSQPVFSRATELTTVSAGTVVKVADSQDGWYELDDGTYIRAEFTEPC